MRRQIANPNTFFVILAAFMLLAVQSLAYGQMVSIDPATVDSPAAGESLTVNINITGGMNVAGYEVTLTFDSTALSYVSIANGDYLPAGAFAVPPVVTDTSAKLAATSLAGTASGDGTLATATFMVVEAKDSAIELEAVVSDPAASAIAVTVQGSMVTGPATAEPEMMEPAEPMEAAIDRFSAAAGTLMVRDDSGALPGPNEPINFDMPPFITQGLGPGGQVVQYYNFDVQPVAPAPIWVLFREGEDDPAQSPVIDVIPGDAGYNDFWGMIKVAVPADYEANSVTSLAGITAAGYAMENTGVIINCPVVPKGSTAMLRGGGESNGLHAGWYKDMVVYYFTFEEKMLSGATVPVSPIYVTFNANGMPPSGFVMEEGTAQTHNVVATIPSDDDYSPLWLVSVYDNAGFDSVSDLASAEAANILAAGVATVNCPVVSVEEMEMPPAVMQEFEVMLTNLTTGAPAAGGQIFSPPIFVTHGHGFSIGASGEAASAELTALAETGNNMPLAELAMGSDAVGSVVAFPPPPDGVVLPGGSVSTMVTASSGMGYLSLATMLVQTNDGIVLGNSLPLFDEDGNPRSFTMDLISYDAGTEENNELATHVPGPPFDGGERAPTEDVITAHPGIAGTADVGAAFGWTEPTASVTVSPVMMPPVEPPVEPEPTVEPTHMFEMALAPGLNMISLPLMPAESYTASSFADMIGATVVIQLDTAMQQFVGFTADQEGDGFAIEGGEGYIVNVPGGGMVTFTGTAWGNTMEDAAAAPSVQLPSTAWAFVVSGDLLETEAGVSYTVVARNHRTGEVATRLVSSDYKEFNAVWADLTRKSVIEAGDTLEVTLLDEWDNIVSGPFTHKVGIEDLRNAYLSLALTVGDVHPAETILGQNFPNPFNPETWIPYQLEKSADVSLQIYDTSGRIVRTIDLGFKSQGFYMTRSTAAYWDGRNNMGEQVASGVYFYSLQTPDFSATRKMLILK